MGGWNGGMNPFRPVLQRLGETLPISKIDA